MADFGTRLATVLADRGPVCLGLDPHPYLLSAWGLPDTPAGLREFSMIALDAAAETIGIVKPQVAFFERHGSAGYEVLEEVLGQSRARGLITIADVKRGDIGSTVDAYAEAWLRPGSTLEADAMTLVAYQGTGSLSGVFDRARAGDKGVFVLSATSNPEAVVVQRAIVDGGSTVAAEIARGVAALNPPGSLGSFGVVIGATVSLPDAGLSAGELAFTPILAPGFGEQGAALSQRRAIYGDLADQAVLNTGRAMLDGGAREVVGRLRAAVAEARSS